MTGPGLLKCRYIIHAVGPRWDRKKSESDNVYNLSNAISNTLLTANTLECESVSIPAISSGIFGFNKLLCAKVFFNELKNYAAKSKNQEQFRKLKVVRLCNFDDETC